MEGRSATAAATAATRQAKPALPRERRLPAPRATHDQAGPGRLRRHRGAQTGRATPEQWGWVIQPWDDGSAAVKGTLMVTIHARCRGVASAARTMGVDQHPLGWCALFGGALMRVLAGVLVRSSDGALRHVSNYVAHACGARPQKLGAAANHCTVCGADLQRPGSGAGVSGQRCGSQPKMRLSAGNARNRGRIQTIERLETPHNTCSASRG
jgi:hypothetical protein